MKALLVLAGSLTITCVSQAQEKYMSNATEVETLSETVVTLFARNAVSNGLAALAPYWPLPENELEALETKTLKYFNLFDESYGASIGTVKTREEKIGDVAIRQAYLIRYGYTAVRLIFTYYKGPEGWLLNAFMWDDKFSEEFR